MLNRRNALFASLFLLVWATLSVAAPAARPLDIYFVDVEGGAATLIVTPAGESILVDTGWPRDDERDAKRIHAAAQQAGIKRIDHLIITHYHTDHYGGVAALARLMPIGRFYDHGPMSPTDTPRDFAKLHKAYQEAANNKTQAVQPGEKIALRRAPGSAPVELLVVASNGQALERRGRENAECRDAQLQKDDPSDNGRSVGFVLSLGKFRFLDLGDLTWNVEHRLVCPVNSLGRIDLYQVTHHGMNVSNNPALLRSVQPQVAIMNNGPKKAGHPDTVKRLRETPSVEDIWAGHKNVAISDEENAPADLTANLEEEKDCPGRAIKVSVAPDGSNYTVTNTRNGKSKTYRIRG